MGKGGFQYLTLPVGTAGGVAVLQSDWRGVRSFTALRLAHRPIIIFVSMLP